MIVQINNNNIYCATGGCAFDSSKTTVLFIHGSGLDHRCWALQSRWFAFHGYSVCAPDMPAHSLSGGDPLHSIEEMGLWIVELINSLQIEAVHLVGHSSGFLVALEAASLLDDKLKSLTAVASAETIPVNEDLINTAKQNAGTAADLMMQWGFGSKSQSGYSAVPGMQPIAIGRQIMANNPLAIDLEACNNYIAGPAKLPQVKCPTHVILAEEDRMTPCKFGKQLATNLNANTAIVEKSGHMLPMESPKRTLDEIRNFVTSV